MKPATLPLQAALLLAALCSEGQGTFLYDQQSSDESHILEGGADIQQNQPMGQSFTPQLSGVGFIRLEIYNGLLGNTSAATISISLRSNSITGPILASTEPVAIPGGAFFDGLINFLFTSPVPVAAGTTYFFQPVVLDNSNLGLNRSSYNYAGGTAFLRGSPDPSNWDLWFREGMLVPEPSSGSLILLGICATCCLRCARGWGQAKSSIPPRAAAIRTNKARWSLMKSGSRRSTQLFP